LEEAEQERERASKREHEREREQSSKRVRRREGRQDTKTESEIQQATSK
jgi:hypothetical protein